jgi:hypothetical protein
MNRSKKIIPKNELIKKLKECDSQADCASDLDITSRTLTNWLKIYGISTMTSLTKKPIRNKLKK